MLFINLASSVILEDIRWCVINQAEMDKCTGLKEAIDIRTEASKSPAAFKHTSYFGPSWKEFPPFSCNMATSQFKCMELISKGQADLMQLETALSYTAGQYFTLMPLMAEKYMNGTGDEGLDFYAVAVVNGSKYKKEPEFLKNKKICSPGVGQAAGWIYPVSYLLEKDLMHVEQCNVPVKSAATYFGDMCAPDGLARFYNTFGTNPVTVCQVCSGTKDTFCTANDPYAGYTGALECLTRGGNDVAFVRHSTLRLFAKHVNMTSPIDSFKLLCKDGSLTDIDSYKACNWGNIPSHVVMTSTMRTQLDRTTFKHFLTLLSLEFGKEGSHKNLFQLFESFQYGKFNLMFSDETYSLKNLADVAGGTRMTYYKWAVNPALIDSRMDLKSRLNMMNKCPLTQATWCVISRYEMQKCERMMMAFSARNLKPDLNCVLGDGAIDCIRKIAVGDADLISLDAADVYTAGRRFHLVPIAAEDYSGKSETGYFAVAVARKRSYEMLLPNLKQRRSCHTAVRSAAGWVIPVDTLIETGQINVVNQNTYLAMSFYFSKSCAPGILDTYYNPWRTNPVSMCEACSTAGPRRCLRSDEELYYGSSGSFRCLVEKGGDVAFTRHMAVYENTNGQNKDYWARNRRSDDYELLCKEGRRSPIEGWMDCNLGWVPSNAIMTAGFKSYREKEIYWTMLSYAQQFYDTDDDLEFSMFDSTMDHKDLIFQDATVRLVPVANLTYDQYLGENFVRLMQRINRLDAITGRNYVPRVTSNLLTIVLLIIVALLR